MTRISQAGTTTDAAVAHAASISPATGTGGRVPGTWWLWGDPAGSVPAGSDTTEPRAKPSASIRVLATSTVLHP